MLCPQDYPIGCKRPVLDTGYFETFNRDNVTLVDLREDADRGDHARPGIRTAEGEFELDVIVFATGFDAMTGALDRIDIRGRGGRLLRDAWADGATHATSGSRPPASRTCSPSPGREARRCSRTWSCRAEQHVEWIGDCLMYMRDHGYLAVEATIEAQDAWVEHVNEVAASTMYTAPNCNSWYLGDNVPGKARVFMPYVAGLHTYIARCEAVVEAGYEGFAFT